MAGLQPADNRQGSNVGSMLAHRLRRWSNIDPALDQSVMFTEKMAEWSSDHDHVLFCETQWRHSVKTRLYNTPSPILDSVKRSDVTRWNQGYIRTFPHTSLY